MNVENRLGKILKLLQGSIRAAGFTQTEVDERIGRRRGYLSHVFQRRVDLKLVDLLRALEVLQVDSGRFFNAAMGGRTESRAAIEDLVTLVASLRDGVSSSPSFWAASVPAAPRSAPEQAQDDERLMERVRTAVRSILAEGDQAGGGLGYGDHGGKNDP